MVLIVVGCVRSSPGVTTTALLLAGCLESSVLVEADPDGGVLAARCGLAREPNLASLAAASRAPRDGLLACTQRHPGGVVPVVVGMASQEVMVTLWRTSGPVLGAALSRDRLERVVVDAGRLTPSSPLLGLLNAATVTVLVTRPRADELATLGPRLEALRAASRRVCLVCVGRKPYEPGRVARALDVDLLGVIEHDERSAMALAGLAGTSRSGLGRTALGRSAREVAAGLAARLALEEQRSRSHDTRR